MPEMFTVSVEGDTSVIAHLVAMPGNVQRQLLRAVTRLALLLQRKVQVEHLSGPTGEHSLSVVTGDLRRSVFNEVTDTPVSVEGKVAFAADVPYAAIHEYGGIIHVPDIVPVTAKALHFTIGGADVFTQFVRAHSITMPERAPLRTSFAEMTPQIKEDMKVAVQEGLEGSLR